MSVSVPRGAQTGSLIETALQGSWGGGGCCVALLLAELSDEVDEFVWVIAVSASELHELFGLGEHGTALGGAGDVDTATATELQKPFVAQQS
jgi:hypothetical protein